MHTSGISDQKGSIIKLLVINKKCMEINREEAQFILALIDRVQLSGKEAGNVAFIQNKFATFLQQPVKETKKEDKK